MKPAFDVKSARLDALAVHLHTSELPALESLLQQRINQYQAFACMPFLLDVQAFEHPEALDIGAITALFARHGLKIIGLRHSNEAWAASAAAHNLAFSPRDKNTADAPAPSLPEPEPPRAEAVQATVISGPTVFVNTPIRTGQQVYAENADLIVTGMVSEGAEIIADGNIHVYGPMRGRALAGAEGNRKARIFIHSMQAELVSVAGIYRNFEQDLPAHLHKKPVQVSLQEDRLVISAIDAE
ncbi:septum site-determining protein MinC [Uruburuella testudinis]|uniref:Probable septum site-determining protein MinC n=1 Tax=Uruburuella testudinis TaxID=1282863 RepID=A0ABY4DSW3_9NEIS|nr:septum site-determining protein MinC [Uruburuella testudinis]UOO82130.1 septum site-determining protein MinC [Uruburuella testudinis]